MSKVSKVGAGVGVILGVVLTGAAVGWWMSRTPATSPEAAAPKTNPTVLASAETNSPAQPKKRSPGEFHKTRRPRIGTNGIPPQIAAAGTNETAEWEVKLDEILSAEGNDPEKVKQL